MRALWTARRRRDHIVCATALSSLARVSLKNANAWQPPPGNRRKSMDKDWIENIKEFINGPIKTIENYLAPLSDYVLKPPSKEALAAAEPEPLFWDPQEDRITVPEPGPYIDNRKQQTHVKLHGQGKRGTCVPFAALAQIEAQIKRTQNGLEVDLSEQYANWLFMTRMGHDQCKDMVSPLDAAYYLKNYEVCEATFCEYKQDVADIRCEEGPSAEAKSNAIYGIQGYQRLSQLDGPAGPSLANTNYLEALLSQGYDIVVGLEIAHIRSDAKGRYDVFLEKNIRDTAADNLSDNSPGHAVLVVGYDRRDPQQPFFIVKNSWGEDQGEDGYFKISYDYFRENATAGYIITGVRMKTPT
jgi:hypothetical protein